MNILNKPFTNILQEIEQAKAHLMTVISISQETRSNEEDSLSKMLFGLEIGLENIINNLDRTVPKDIHLMKNFEDKY